MDVTLRRDWKRTAVPWLRLGIVAVVIWLLATKLDLRRLAETTRQASWAPLIGSVALFGLDYLLKTYKWMLLVRAQGLPARFGQLARVSLKGYFLSFFVPSAITADLYKGVALFTSVGAGHVVTSSIVLERLLGLTSIVIVSAIGVSVLPARMFGLDSAVSIFVAAGITVVAFAAFLHADRVAAALARVLPARWHRLTGLLQNLAAAFAEYRPRPGLLAWTLVLSAAIQFTRGGATWLVARALHDHTPFWAFLLFVPYLYIVNMIPVATSRFGLEQGAFIVLFGAVGMPPETALAVSLLSVFATLLIALPGGWFFLTEGRVRRPAAGSGPSRLVVHADDFGETAEITKGIAQAIEAGAVTSTSILANMPATDYAIAEARRLGERASFGVHLNFCEGRPLTAAASLSGRDGGFVAKRTLALRAFLGRLDREELKREIAAQIERVRAGGVRVSHLDSHKHLHQLPGIARAVAEAAAEAGIERVRCTLEEDAWPAGARGTAGLSRLIRLGLARRFARRLAATGARHPVRIFDLAQLMRAPAAEQVELLRRPGAISEMFCHPGTEEADREKPGSCDRHGELRYLTSPGFAALRRDAGVELVTYWEV